MDAKDSKENSFSNLVLAYVNKEIGTYSLQSQRFT